LPITKVGVPLTPMRAPSCMSAWMSASNFVDAVHDANAFASRFRSAAAFVM
jgi:hypothetical protein